MALPITDQAKYWGVLALVFFAVLWLLGDVILPFVLGGAIAYCLDPVADRLEDAGLSRGWAVGLITLVALLFFIILILFLIPLLMDQATQLVQTAPQLAESLQARLQSRFPSMMAEDGALREQLTKLAQLVQDRAGELFSGVLSSVSGFLNLLVLFVIVPVVAFYLLLDWDNMVAKIDAQIPRDHVDTVRNLAREMDDTLASFIRGQGTVCLILGTFYSIALMLVGLNFGVVVGAIAGILTFIPYVGALVGGGLAIGLALFQFWGEWWWIVAVAVIFQVGQLVEGNILTPKMVGDSVGLHPVWLLFALSAFGALFGFVGLLVAVPVAAVLGVLVRFALEQYRDSKLYRGKT